MARALSQARRAAPWPRGTLAVIGGTHLLVVKEGNAQMGVAVHDCPAGFVAEDGMALVFDRLYGGYGNGIDTKGKGGPDQRQIFSQGLGFIRREFPLVDILQNCPMSPSDVRRALGATARVAEAPAA